MLVIKYIYMKLFFVKIACLVRPKIDVLYESRASKARVDKGPRYYPRGRSLIQPHAIISGNLGTIIASRKMRRVEKKKEKKTRDLADQIIGGKKTKRMTGGGGRENGAGGRGGQYLEQTHSTVWHVNKIQTAV